MNAAYVVDASVAVKWVVEEIDDRRAEALLRSGAILHAPDLLRIEVSNALWRHVRKRAIGREQAERGLAAVEGSVHRWHASNGLCRRALDLATTLDHPVYDCLYLALAERENCPLVTADARLSAKAASLAGPRVIPLTALTPDTAP